jgi:hypothetical protein
MKSLGRQLVYAISIRNKEYIGDIRVDLICGIFANHVLDGHVTARVKFDPSIQSEYFVVDNDNQLILGNHAFNLSP